MSHKELPVYPKGHVQKLNKNPAVQSKDWNCRIGSANPNRRGPPRPRQEGGRIMVRPTPDNPV